MGKNVAVFVDVANIFYAAKAAGVDIDYVTLLKASSAGRDLVRAYAYTGLDPDNENQRNFHDFLRRHGYKVVSKDIRKYGDGKVKANLDIELVVDMMKTARNLDIAIVVSGDGDFAPAIRAVQEQGVRVEVVSFRGNTSSDLMDVADLFTDITQIAKVEKGSSRSGRRVADDEGDLSMTEVPEKQSEGTGERGRGRGRTRRIAASPAPVRGRERVAAVASGEPALVVLPGERLSRAATGPGEAEPGVAALDEADIEQEAGEALPAGASSEESYDEARRRRRRRGGRGRGRGRGRDEVAVGPAPAGEPIGDLEDADEEDEPQPARRPASTFGSVWDSQIGIAASSKAPTPRATPYVEDDEDLEEPSVPEYLIAERRQRDGARGGRGGGGRGRGGAYAAALDRERFGGGRGSTVSRFQEPAPRGREGGGREGGRDFSRGGGDRPPFRPAPRPAPRPSSDEPWSEVPPEIEAMLRAQIGRAPEPRREPASRAASTTGEPRAELATSTSADAAGAEAGTKPPARRGGARQAPATSESTTAATGRGRARRSGAAAAEPAVPAASGAEAIGTDAGAAAPAATARRRSTRSAAVTAAGASDEVATPAAKPAPKARATATRSRTKAAPAAATPEAPFAEGEAAAPKRRTTRKKAEPAD